MFTAEDAAALAEVCALVDEGYARIRVGQEHWPEGIGYVGVSFGWTEDRAVRVPVDVYVDLYGFVLGAGEEHFNSAAEALDATRRWHARVLARFCWRCNGSGRHAAACPLPGSEGELP